MAEEMKSLEELGGGETVEAVVAAPAEPQRDELDAPTQPANVKMRLPVFGSKQGPAK